MGSTLAALKALYVAFGGDADDVADIVLIPGVINKLATLISSTGGTLPAVSATDNGSVLKVADGAWSVGTDNT